MPTLTGSLTGFLVGFDHDQFFRNVVAIYRRRERLSQSVGEGCLILIRHILISCNDNPFIRCKRLQLVDLSLRKFNKLLSMFEFHAQVRGGFVNIQHSRSRSNS